MTNQFVGASLLSTGCQISSNFKLFSYKEEGKEARCLVRQISFDVDIVHQEMGLLHIPFNSLPYFALTSFLSQVQALQPASIC